ncbi:hypothetical protein FDECE_5419 [Fusarium decemcellulare]|nr:hypothetical protein FDECE_5419 [Fusarium decemcellulare]
MCVVRSITLTKLWLLPSSNQSGGDNNPEIQRYGRTTSIQIKAWFGSECKTGFISPKLVEQVLGPQTCERSGFCPFVGISWCFPITNESPETSRLQVASELKNDVVFGCVSDTSWQKCSVAQPPLFPNSSPQTTAHWSEKKPISTSAATDNSPGRDESSETDNKFTNGAFPDSLAASYGIRLADDPSRQAFARLWRQRLGHSSMPVVRPLDECSGLVDSHLHAEEVEGSVSSRFDNDLDCAWSAAASEEAFDMALPQAIPLRHSAQADSEGSSKVPSQAVQVTPGSSPEDSTSSWQLVRGASEEAAEGKDGSMKNPPTETWEGGGSSVSSQSQQSEFEAHPGHKIWVWDVDKQRWRRRGQSGLEETDWFPMSLA